MKDEMDDYLWDGSGEPDAEIEHLEKLLGRFRSEAQAPAIPVAPVVVARPRRTFVPALVAAAAFAVVALGSGIWMTLQKAANVVAPSDHEIANVPPTPGPRPSPNVGTPKSGGDESEGLVPPAPRHSKAKPTPRAKTEIVPVASETQTGARHSAPKPLFDFDTAHHLEQTELLLRSFMNAKLDESADAEEIAYDKRRSRELLDRNVLLRLGAESKGNFPTEDVLGSVEPYLLDIANLGEKASPDDVRAIQERLQKREIVADLQIYALNGPKMGF